VTDHGLAAVAACLAFAGGAIGAAIGNGLAGNAAMTAVARQPDANGRVQYYFFLVISLAEAAYFINVALGFFLATTR
jgi:F-type H+-transporting ATPase subunit c